MKGRETETDRQTETERNTKKDRETQNSKLYYSSIEILGNSLFLQSVLAKLHKQHI